MRIAVAGLGYVGLSNAVLLAQNHDVTAVDIDQDRVDQINARISPISDPELEDYLRLPGLHLSATTDGPAAYSDADFVVIATPTNYDSETSQFDTASVMRVIEEVVVANPAAIIVIKSTIPVGFVEKLRAQEPGLNVMFSPEFLREGRALFDNLHPSRIVVGDCSDKGRRFAELLLEGAKSKDVPVLLTGASEAEAIKLFANTYLAMRVAFFNELDSYALVRDLDSRQIIEGISFDPRIGNYYNNPSFGYGGYCLPKDTKQLLAGYTGVPQNLIAATIEANRTRKNLVARHIIDQNPRTVGIHRLGMKAGSDNFRQSSITGIIFRLKAAGLEIIIFEPGLPEAEYFGSQVINDLTEFKRRADLIVANRRSSDLDDVASKLFTRDLFGSD